MPSTPSDRNREALRTIEDHVLEAQAFLAGFDQSRFGEDRRTFHAVTRCLEVISEASRRIAPEVRARHPEIPWRDIADAGNLYRHAYDDVSPSRIFKTANDDLAALLKVVREELALE